VTKKWADHIT